MSDLDAVELGRQLSKPSGENGVAVGKQMHVSNVGIYELVFSFLTVENGAKILEIGFGSGSHFNDYFNKNSSIQLYGIDYSDSMCSMAGEINRKLIDKNVLQIVCDDARSMPFENEMFDSVISINTVYFWDVIQDYLKEIKRVLKKGGKLYLGFRPKSRMDNLDFVKEKFKLYEPSDIKDELLRTGFNVLAIKEKDIERISVDGRPVKTVDVCVVAEKLQ